MNAKDNIDFVFKYLMLILNMETEATAGELRKTTRNTIWDTTNILTKHTSDQNKEETQAVSIGHHKSGV